MGSPQRQLTALPHLAQIIVSLALDKVLEEKILKRYP